MARCGTNCNQSRQQLVSQNDTGNGSVHCFEDVESKYFCLPRCLFTKIWHLYLLEQVWNGCSISMRVYLGNSFLSLLQSNFNLSKRSCSFYLVIYLLIHNILVKFIIQFNSSKSGKDINKECWLTNWALLINFYIMT